MQQCLKHNSVLLVLQRLDDNKHSDEQGKVLMETMEVIAEEETKAGTILLQEA
jgi:hypothetical protein